jgi:hypothetical protein
VEATTQSERGAEQEVPRATGEGVGKEQGEENQRRIKKEEKFRTANLHLLRVKHI